MRKLRLRRESEHCPRSHSEWQSQGFHPGLFGQALHSTHSDLNCLFPECIVGEFQGPLSVVHCGSYAKLTRTLSLLTGYYPSPSPRNLHLKFLPPSLDDTTLRSSIGPSEFCSVPEPALGVPPNYYRMKEWNLPGEKKPLPLFWICGEFPPPPLKSQTHFCSWSLLGINRGVCLRLEILLVEVLKTPH